MDAGHGWREGKKEWTVIREKWIWPAETTLTSLGLLANAYVARLCFRTMWKLKSMNITLPFQR